MQRRLLLAVTSVVAFMRTVPTGVRADVTNTGVTIDNFSFSPALLTVGVGTRVTWINRDNSPHTVVDRDNPRAMRSPPLDTGDQFGFAFDHPGTFHYFCSLHPHMQGTVVVQ